MEIADRIKEVIIYSGKSTRAVAIACGLNQPTLDRQIKKINNVNIETVTSILKCFPEVSADWLLLGNGFMLREDNRVEKEREDMDRLIRLADTINTLQDTINTKNDTISILTARIKELESQLNK